MDRRPDWMERLEAHVRTMRGREFSYGVLDCALWAAGAVEAMTGVDPVADLRGAYETEEQGLALLAAKGFRNHVEVAVSRLEEIPVGHAQPGDLIVVEGAALGVMQGRFAWVMTLRGLGIVGMEHAERAFRV